MQSMRDIMALVEAPRAKKGAVPAVAFNRDALAGKLMSIQSILGGIAHGFAFTPEWVEELMKQAQQQKLEYDAEMAKEVAAAHEHGDEFQPEPFNLMDVFGDLADKLVARNITNYSITSDTRYLEREYQDRKVTDPDNPMDYVEDSDFLRFIRCQDAVANTIDSVVPSKPSTYAGFVSEIERAIEAYSNNSQDEGLIWSENLQKSVSYLVPMMRFCLKNL